MMLLYNEQSVHASGLVYYNFESENVCVSVCKSIHCCILDTSAVVQVGFQSPSYPASEESGVVTVCAELTGDVARTGGATVSLSTLSTGTAQGTY